MTTNINRDNYEEYFLLYADNELSAQEKNAVEDFVQQHPDLEEELILFKLSVTKPDDNCKLEDKSILFKDSGGFINNTNYEEVFVLYNDDELTVDERKNTEEFLSVNPSFKNEFELLQKVKLQADAGIVFPDKNLLYKREETKIIPFKWWRVAAAAMLLGTGIWFGISYLQKNTTTLPAVNSPVVNNNTLPKPVESNSDPTDNITEEPKNVVAENKSTEKKIGKSVKRSKLLKQVNSPVVPIVQNEVKSSPKNEIITKDNKEPAMNEQVPSAVQPKNDIASVKKGNNDNDDRKKLSNEVTTADKDSAPTLTSFTDANENSYNYAFYNIPQEKFNKTKVGGFLRKVKRIIERRISPFGKDKTETEVN